MSVGQRTAPLGQVGHHDTRDDLAGAGGQPVTLSELVQRARGSHDEEQQWLAGLINQTLEALPTLDPNDRDRQVALVLEFLDDEALHGLVGNDGVACRAMAVDALLRVGYPWALQLEPEDIDFYRSQKSISHDRARWPPNLAAGVAGVSSAAWVGASLMHAPTVSIWLRDRLSDPIDLALLVGLVGSMAGAVTMLARPAFSSPWTWARRLMMLATLSLSGALLADFLGSGLTYLHGLFLVPTVGAALAAFWPRPKD